MDKILSNKKVTLGVLAVVIVVILFACSGRGYKDTSVDFVEAMLDGNAKKMVSLMSEDLVDELMEKKGSETKKVLINTLDRSLESTLENMKDRYGKNWKYDIEYVDAYVEDEFCTAVLNVTYKGKSWLSEKEDTDTIEIELYKVGKNWYVDAYPNVQP